MDACHRAAELFKVWGTGEAAGRIKLTRCVTCTPLSACRPCRVYGSEPAATWGVWCWSMGVHMGRGPRLRLPGSLTLTLKDGEIRTTLFCYQAVCVCGVKQTARTDQRFWSLRCRQLTFILNLLRSALFTDWPKFWFVKKIKESCIRLSFIKTETVEWNWNQIHLLTKKKKTIRRCLQTYISSLLKRQYGHFWSDVMVKNTLYIEPSHKNAHFDWSSTLLPHIMPPTLNSKNLVLRLVPLVAEEVQRYNLKFSHRGCLLEAYTLVCNSDCFF